MTYYLVLIVAMWVFVAVVLRQQSSPSTSARTSAR